MLNVTMGRLSGNKSGVSSDLFDRYHRDARSTGGLDREKSQLYDYIDVDALEQLLYSSNGNVEVQFAVEEIRLTVTPEGVDVLDDKALPSGRVGDWCHARVGPDPGSYLNTFDDDSA